MGRSTDPRSIYSFSELSPQLAVCMWCGQWEFQTGRSTDPRIHACAMRQLSVEMIEDSTGDRLKDTSGPLLNVLMKLAHARGHPLQALLVEEHTHKGNQLGAPPPSRVTTALIKFLSVTVGKLQVVLV